MKNLLPLLFFFTLVNTSFSQDYVSNEAIEIDIERSSFSVGISPIIFVPINGYSDGPGIGLELIPMYSFNKNFSVGGFLKTKTEIDGSSVNPPGTGTGNGGKVFINGAASIGGLFEYKMFNKIAVNFRLGYEEIFSKERISNYNYTNGTTYYTYEENTPGLVYGGGFSLYISRDDDKRAVHSFNWGVTFESNNFTNVDMLNISTNEFESTEVNAFYIQFGWRIQFHGLRAKK